MIDDGLHEFHANTTFMESSLHMLKPGGVFIVEDIGGDQLAFFMIN